MLRRLAITLAVAAVFTTGHALAQAVPNPTQDPIPVPAGPVPVFRVSVVAHTTPAVNYRPRGGDTTVDLRGTVLMPLAEGEAKVSGEQGYMNIEAEFDNIDAASSFGPEFLTYVLWAITPEGRATNLGEIQIDRNDRDSDIKVTTELQAFGLIVTAEPYFAVTQPSDVVVMENAVRPGTEGVEVVQAEHELLTRGSYLMRQDAASLDFKPLAPGESLDLAEARNAVTLARAAGADRFAEASFTKATELLAAAEAAHAEDRDESVVMMAARQAVQTAEDARLVGLQRQEAAFAAAERQQARAREEDLRGRAQAAVVAQILAENDAQTAAAGQASAERAAATANAARTAAETVAAQSGRDTIALRARLREQLTAVMDTRETARGLVVNLSDVLFTTGSATLTPDARESLARLSGILVSHEGLRLEVEGHTDNVGTEAGNQELSERRAESVRAYLVSQRIPTASVDAMGFGEDQPVATNETATGRGQNRRVELVVSGDVIGTP